MKRSLPILIHLISFSILIAVCTSLPLSKKGDKERNPSPASIGSTTSLLSNNEKSNTPPGKPIIQTTNNFFQKHRSALIAILCLLFLLAAYKHIQLVRINKKIKLDDQEIAMLGLAADTLNDLCHRLQAKSKIIPFYRRH